VSGPLLPPGDPLAGTLRLLPWLLAGFYAIGRLAVRQGARRLARTGSVIELVVLALAVAAALVRPVLGLAHADLVIAGGLLLVLAHRVMRQMLALRPLLGSRLGARPAALFFWLPLAAYLAILPWSAAHRQPDGDEPYNLLVAHSLAYDGDTDLRNNYAAGDWRFFMDHPIAPQPGDPVGAHGEIYSRHNALLPLVLVPAYRLAGRTGAQITMALLAAALAWWTLRLARHYTADRPGETLVAYAWLVAAPPLAFYSYQIWVEVPAALLVVVALDAILGGTGARAVGASRAAAAGDGAPALEPVTLEPTALEPAALEPLALEPPALKPATLEPATLEPPALEPPALEPATLEPTRLEPATLEPLALEPVAAVAAVRWPLWLAVALLPLLKIRFILIAAPLVALAGWEMARQDRRRWRPVLALAALLGALVGAILLYNQKIYANPLKIHSWGEVDPQQHSPLDYLAGGLGLFWDAAFGLFGFAPIWLLLLPALALLLVRRSRLPAHIAILMAPYLLVVTPRGEWYGGWSPPFRYALIGLPLLALSLPPLLAARRRPGARALLASLGVLTLALAVACLVVPGWTFNFADGRTYLLDHLSTRLGADLARFFPSYVRPRAATWIWPPLSLALLTAAWWLRAPRRRLSPPLLPSPPAAAPAAGRPGEPPVAGGAEAPRVAGGARIAGGAEAPRVAGVARIAGGAEAPRVAGVARIAGGAGARRVAGGARAAGAAGLAGIAVVAAAAALLPWAATHVPTRVVELEDPQVAKLGGHLYPDRWVIERTLYRGGWVVRVGDQVRAPVVAGGRRVRLTLAAQLIRNQPVPFAIDIAAGDRLLAVWTPTRERTWEDVSLGPFDWPAGQPLVLAGHGPSPPGALNGAILDRIDLVWE
jgi:hypothetical protein